MSFQKGRFGLPSLFSIRNNSSFFCILEYLSSIYDFIIFEIVEMAAFEIVPSRGGLGG
jgi:hypothetical protein